MAAPPPSALSSPASGISPPPSTSEVGRGVPAEPSRFKRPLSPPVILSTAKNPAAFPQPSPDGRPPATFVSASSARAPLLFSHPWLAPLILTLALFFAYSNSHDAPFAFDDRPAILANPTLDSFATALSPPRDGGTVAGRPLLNLTFHLNRQLSGTNPWSYHALNLAIHLLATLTLHSLLLRTLRSFNFQPSTFNREAVALATASLWSLHPLQTAAVTYTVQRAESLASLLILLSLHAFARHSTASPLTRLTVSPPHRPTASPSLLLSVLACLAGMATKETAAVTPLLILLYDRTFISGTFRTALRARPRFYTALAATWLLLAYLVAANSARTGTAGFAAGISPLDYAFTQCRALTLYLKLALWPAPLVFDYGTPLDRSLATAAPFLLFLAALLISAILLTRRCPAARFLLLTTLLLLAPTTLVPIATQTIAEHRLYLALAPFVLGLVLFLARRTSRLHLVTVPLALTFATLTYARNRTYSSALTLWSDTAQKRPDNPRAHNNAGIELARAHRPAEAAAHYEQALRFVLSADAELHHNYATVLLQLGRPAEAIEHFAHAIRVKPTSWASQLSLATALANAGRPAAALTHFAAAEELKPLPADALVTQAALLAQTNQLPAAISRYRAALALTPSDARLHYNLGLALARTNDFPAAIAAWRDCLRLDERHIPARVNLANTLLLTRRIDEAITEYETTLRLDPTNLTARQNLARARALAEPPARRLR